MRRGIDVIDTMSHRGPLASAHARAYRQRMDASAADYLRAVILGVIQALTEFLPISSSGHLLLAGEVMGEEISSLTFDVGLHAGTLAAVLIYFWRDWTGMARSSTVDLMRHRWHLARWSAQGRLASLVALGTLPAVLAGVTLDNVIEAHVRGAGVVGVMLLLGAGLLWLADRTDSARDGLGEMDAGRSTAIGLAQAVALIPGVSRSGMTISAARFLGFDRVSAARFSFLLSAPVVAGAATLKLGQAVAGDEVVAWGPLMVGALASGVCGVLVIRALLGYMQRRTLAVFVWYRIALGLAVLAAVATGLL
ncbi:MAG: undecaprenyl-diphosphate phosphatase [Dehalococcoidia bacterium]|nr:MAG: undecaprenyl-diphosphate phosphatase [Dehalococcoidia bacterium]